MIIFSINVVKDEQLRRIKEELQGILDADVPTDSNAPPEIRNFRRRCHVLKMQRIFKLI